MRVKGYFKWLVEHAKQQAPESRAEPVQPEEPVFEPWDEPETEPETEPELEPEPENPIIGNLEPSSGRTDIQRDNQTIAVNGTKTLYARDIIFTRQGALAEITLLDNT